jgi:hypothetical protein
MSLCGTCRGDGFCYVWEHVWAADGTFHGYQRIQRTEWCKCDWHKMFCPCPNSFYCGNIMEPKCLLQMQHGRCFSCDCNIGGDLTFVRGEELPEGWECPVCMEAKRDACVFPACPGKHLVCLCCLEKLIRGVPNPRYKPDSDSEDIEEHPYEGATNACPMCRHQFSWFTDWSDTDDVPLMLRQSKKC